jgi:hypothetical protein
MKRKSQQWCSSIPPIKGKRTITCRLNWTHWTQKRARHIDIGNSGPDLGQAQSYGGVKPVNGISVYTIRLNWHAYREYNSMWSHDISSYYDITMLRDEESPNAPYWSAFVPNSTCIVNVTAVVPLVHDIKYVHSGLQSLKQPFVSPHPVSLVKVVYK